MAAITPRSKRYGWIADLPDHRDHIYAAPVGNSALPLPPKVDLRTPTPPRLPEPYDQGQIGSCTANAIAGAVQYARRKASRAPDFLPSRLFIYWNERDVEHTVAVDNGAQIRNGIKVVAKRGAPSEDVWPYDDTAADPVTHLWPTGAKPTVKPAPPAYAQGSEYQVIGYQRISRALSQLRGVLASGFPFVFGFAVYSAFESNEIARTGVLGLPGPAEELLGGHAVLAVGYDDSSARFLVRNSWGAQWGQAGHFTIPYAYLLDEHLADDFWTIRVVED
jgi:C1A family cysteine protease